MGKKPPCEHPINAQKIDPRTGRITCRNCGATLGYDLTGRRSTLGNGEHAMNLRNAILIVFVLALSILAGAATAYADEPQPLNWMYGAVKCTSLPIAVIQNDYQEFVTEYGFAHNLPDGALRLWELAYPSTVNEYVRAFGCPDALNADGTRLTIWFEHYRLLYIRALVPPKLRGEIP